MPPKGKGGKGGGKAPPGGKSVVVEKVVETDPEKFILSLLKKVLPNVGSEELELGENTMPCATRVACDLTSLFE